MSNARRASAINAARRLSTMHNIHSMRSDENLHTNRRISVVGGPGSTASTPSTLRRSVSAFGEITVMPVGDEEDENMRINVEEEFYK